MPRSLREWHRRFAEAEWAELFDRTRQELCKRWDLARYHLGLEFRDLDTRAESRHHPHFFFEPCQVPDLVALLQIRLPETAKQIVAQAEQVCAHQLDLLGYTNLDYGREIDWHLDKVHERRAPHKPWFKIRYLDFNEVGDAKVTWELNRHQHLVTLAKAFRISGDQRFAQELFAQWYGWGSQNPYPFGINWASSLEVGFRSLSWLWVRHLMQDSQAVPPGFGSDLSQALALSGRHIERYLSTYFSPNTHLLGEGVALFFIGTLCPEIRSARRWQQLGWKIVLQAAEGQVLADGMHLERSTYYQVYALDFFLHAGLLAARNDVPVPAAFDETMEKMAGALCSISQAGVPACFGDDDGGRVFDPRRNRPEHLLDPLATAAVAFGRSDFKQVARGLTEESLWLLGAEGAHQFDELAPTPYSRASRALPESGLYVMVSADPLPQQLLIDAGPQCAQNPGHGHADALSLQLVVDGRRLLIDSGTGGYVGPDDERNTRRATSAHNTLRIDRCDQMIAQGPFTWAGVAEGRAERWIAGHHFDYFAGRFNGYRRLPGAPLHRRFMFHRKSGFWLVRDRVEGEGSHHVDVSWHMGPDLIRHAGATPSFMNADRTLGVALVWLQDRRWAQVVAKEPVSPVYGVSKSSVALRLEREVELPTEFAALLVPMFEPSNDLGVLTRMDLTPEPMVYRYAAGRQEHQFFFADGRPWTFGDWASDAEFLFWRADESGFSEIFGSNLSYLDFHGERVASSGERVAVCELFPPIAASGVPARPDSMVLHRWPKRERTDSDPVEAASNLAPADS